MRISLFALFIFFAISSYAAVFTVTSNADSGSGTLREAMTLATDNGYDEKDYINFAILGNSEADRTLLILSNLPPLSSNLVIDATTQNSSKIGVSDCKIILKTVISRAFIDVFNGKEIHNIEIYGFYFLDAADHHLSQPNANWKAAINISDSNNITIGEHAKGNVFNGYPTKTMNFKNIDGLNLWSNIIGQNPYDATYYSTAYLTIEDVNHLQMGGAQRGNLVFAVCRIYYTPEYMTNNFVATIANNDFGVTTDGTTIYVSHLGTWLGVQGLPRTDDQIGKLKAVVVIKDNVFSNECLGINIQSMSGQFKVIHNWFGVDRSGERPFRPNSIFKTNGTGIDIQHSNAEIVVGDDHPDLGNFFSNLGLGLHNLVSPNVIVKRNTFECMTSDDYKIEAVNDLPEVTIEKASNSMVSGLGTVGAIVDLFSSDDCGICAPNRFLGSTTIGADGTWQYLFEQSYAGYTVANAHSGNTSSDFTKATINPQQLQIIDYSCKGLGRISGIAVTNTKVLKWINEKGETVSMDLDLKNVLPGKYQLIVGETCPAVSAIYEVKNDTPIIYTNFATLKKPSCGQANGSIENIFVTSSSNKTLSYNWKNEKNELLTTTRNLSNIPAGIYTLTASDGTCSVTSPPFVLNATNGSIILDDKVVIKEASCGNADGSIQQINVTGLGQIVYQWKNQQQQIVGTSSDLLNMPGGKYILNVMDNSGCEAVYSREFTIPELNAITIDSSLLNVVVSRANIATGSITGLKIDGATDYKWYNTAHELVGQAVDLHQVPNGIYYLKANNAFCTQVTQPIKVGLYNLNNNYPSTKILVNASCGLANGSIEVIFTKDQPTGFRWEDAQGRIIGANRKLEGIDAGTYKLYIKDEEGVEYYLSPYAISKVAAISVHISNIDTDECGQGLGAISGVEISGGVKPYQLDWVDVNGKVLVSGGGDLKNLKGGLYYLKVEDAKNCVFIKNVSLPNSNEVINPPTMRDITICNSGNVSFSVQYPNKSYNYFLYNNTLDSQPIAHAKNGIFNVNVEQTSVYYLSQKLGTCESDRIAFNINMGLPPVKINNTFSPNGDGVNDIWQIEDLNNYVGVSVQIFNRNGQELFKSQGIFNGFDGTYQNQVLPVGTYYYIINFSSNCKPISGSLTIIR